MLSGLGPTQTNSGAETSFTLCWALSLGFLRVARHSECYPPDRVP